MSLQTRFDKLEEELHNRREENAQWILENDCDIDEEIGLFDVPITFNSFQDCTLISKERDPKHVKDIDLYYCTALAGEIGELLNYTKKNHRNDGGNITEKRADQIFSELGDSLFYLARLAHFYGFKLEDIAKENHAKMLKKLKEWRNEQTNLEG